MPATASMCAMSRPMATVIVALETDRTAPVPVEVAADRAASVQLPLELPKADIGPLAENEFVDPEHAEPLTKMLAHASRAKVGSVRRLLRTHG